PKTRPEDFWKPRPQEFMLRTLVDQKLILQDAGKLPSTQVTDEEIDACVVRLQSQFSASDDSTRFERRLDLVGLKGPQLQAIARDRLRIGKYIEFRFGSFVIVTE